MVKSGTAPIGPEAVASGLFEGTAYRGLRQFGAGAMGELFLVVHRNTRREFVAKVLHASLAADAQLVDRFRLEGQAHGRLSHSNVVTVAGRGTTADGRPFIVLERLEGRTLSEEIRERGKLPVLEALTYARELLSALHAAHELGIVHRDIKPDNLFLCPRANGKRRLKVLDFGVARIIPNAPAGAPAPLAVPTDTGAVIGTPHYASPEAARTQRDVDARSDVYSAALVLYLMLTGRGPFDELRTPESILAAHAELEPPPPSRFTDEPLPPELDRAILRGLRKDRRERFQTAEEFMTILERVADALTKPAGWLETTAFAPIRLDMESELSATSEQASTVVANDAEPAFVINDALAREWSISESGPRLRSAELAPTSRASATEARPAESPAPLGPIHAPPKTSFSPKVTFLLMAALCTVLAASVVIALGRWLR